MPRPGTSIISRAAVPPRGAPTDTGVWFVCGITEKGDLTPQTLHNMGDYTAKLGARVSYGLLYDSIETFLRERGNTVVVSRVVGPAAAPAVRTLVDRAGAPLNTLDVQAQNPGQWGNALTVQVANGSVGNSFVLIIALSGVEVERSYDLLSPTDAVTWGAQFANYVNVVDRASGTVAPNNNPAVLAATALAGGTDDRTNILDAHWDLALAKFTKDLGPGQVSYPGRTTTAAYLALSAHAAANNRTPILDGADTASDTTLNAAADSVRAAAVDPSYGALFAPWVIIPGLTVNTTRTAPQSAFVAALMARGDATGGGTNVPAAGDNGQAQFVIGVTQQWDDATREAMNNKGVNVIRMVYGGVRLYGYRTLVDPINHPEWLALSNQRLRMEITNKAYILAEQFAFDQIDGRHKKISEFGGALAGMLHDYWIAGELFGEDASDAFTVDVGDAINTIPRIANLELHAVLSVRMSPFAEFVQIEIVKVPITQSL